MDKEIIDGNILICDFMGWQHHDNETYDKYEMENLKYHSDWSWIMPVVKKIKLTPMIKGVVMRQTGIWEKIEDELVSIEIESLWLAVVQFIQWFNNHNKS